MTENSYRSKAIPDHVRDLRDSLPDEITSSVATNPRNEPPYRLDVAALLLRGDRPYYSSTQAAAALEMPTKKETVQKRLDHLCECGVANSETVGDVYVYWLAAEKSAWGLPPDVEVRSKSDLPVSEFVQTAYGRMTLLGIGSVCVGCLATWGGGALLATGVFSTVSFYTIAFGLFCLPVGLITLLAGFGRYVWEYRDAFGSSRLLG